MKNISILVTSFVLVSLGGIAHASDLNFQISKVLDDRDFAIYGYPKYEAILQTVNEGNIVIACETSWSGYYNSSKDYKSGEYYPSLTLLAKQIPNNYGFLKPEPEITVEQCRKQLMSAVQQIKRGEAKNLVVKVVPTAGRPTAIISAAP